MVVAKHTLTLDTPVIAFASNAIYVLVALIWLIPDRRIERLLRDAERKQR